MDLAGLPDDPAALKSIIATLTAQRDRAARERDQAARQRDEVQLRALRLEHQLEQLKKRYYGPRADTLDVGQLLLEFATALEHKPVRPDDLPPGTSPQEAKDIRRVRRGRRRIGDLDKLPVIQKLHDLSPEQKPCPCCGNQRQKIGQESTWQVEYFPGHFGRIASGSSGTVSMPARIASRTTTRRSRWPTSLSLVPAR